MGPTATEESEPKTLGPREPGGRRRRRGSLEQCSRHMFILGSRPAPRRSLPVPLPRASYSDVNST